MRLHFQMCCVGSTLHTTVHEALRNDNDLTAPCTDVAELRLNPFGVWVSALDHGS